MIPLPVYSKGYLAAICLLLFFITRTTFGELPSWYVPAANPEAAQTPLLDLRHLQLVSIAGLDVAEWCEKRLEREDLTVAERARCNQIRADALSFAGQYEQACQAYEEVLKHFPDDLDARYGYALALGREGHVDRAEEVLLRLTEDHPSFAPGHTLLAAVYHDQKRWKESAHHAELALSHDSDDAHAHLLRAAVKILEHKYADALADLDRAVLLEPFNPKAPDRIFLLRGTTLMMLDRQDEALASFEMALHLNPDSHATMRNVWAAYWLMGRWPQSLMAAEKMAELDETAEATQRALTISRTALGLYDEAIAAAQQWVNAKPRSGEAKLKLAGVLALSGRHGQAKTAYQELLLEPSFEVAKRDYAILLSLSNDPEVADPMSAKVLLETIDEHSRGPIWHASMPSHFTKTIEKKMARL